MNSTASAPADPAGRNGQPELRQRRLARLGDLLGALDGKFFAAGCRLRRGGGCRLPFGGALAFPPRLHVSGAHHLLNLRVAQVGVVVGVGLKLLELGHGESPAIKQVVRKGHAGGDLGICSTSWWSRSWTQSAPRIDQVRSAGEEILREAAARILVGLQAHELHAAIVLADQGAAQALARPRLAAAVAIAALGDQGGVVDRALAGFGEAHLAQVSLEHADDFGALAVGEAVRTAGRREGLQLLHAGAAVEFFGHNVAGADGGGRLAGEEAVQTGHDAFQAHDCGTPCEWRAQAPADN